MAEYLLLEDGTSRIVLEDASGLLLLEESRRRPPTPPGVAIWTFMLTDIDTGDELADLTSVALTAKISPRLNRPLTLQLELPADDPDIRATAAGRRPQPRRRHPVDQGVPQRRAARERDRLEPLLRR